MTTGRDLRVSRQGMHVDTRIPIPQFRPSRLQRRTYDREVLAPIYRSRGNHRPAPAGMPPTRFPIASRLLLAARCIGCCCWRAAMETGSARPRVEEARRRQSAVYFKLRCTEAGHVCERYSTSRGIMYRLPPYGCAASVH